MSDFAPWLRPTLLGPFVTLFGLVTISHLAVGGALDEVILAGHSFDSWVFAMAFAAMLGSPIVVSLILADVMLLAAKLRRLPRGFGAWLSAMLAPFALFFAWHVIGDGGESALEAVLALLLPFPVSALAVRFVLGQKP